MAVEKKSDDKGGKLGVDDLVVQTAMAFGHGAGGINVTQKASALLRAFFTPRFKHHLSHYRDNRLGILAYATGLGWYAKTLAGDKGRNLIGATDVRRAIDKLPCPLMPEVFALLDKMRKNG